MPSFSYQFSADTKVEVKALYIKIAWPSYNGLMLDPRTLKIWDVPYTRSASEDRRTTGVTITCDVSGPTSRVA